MSGSHGTTIEDIEKNPQLQWDYTKVFANPNLTPENYKFLIDKVDFRYLAFYFGSIGQNKNFDI